MRILILFILAALTVFGQPAPENVNRTLQFKNNESMPAMKEMATVVRSLTEIRQANVDAEKQTFTLNASASELAAAEWLFNQLDRPTAQKATAEFRTEGGDLVHVFYLKHTTANPEIQEIATVVRSVGELRRLFVYGQHKAIAVRGSESDMARVTWLLQELDQPANSQSAPRVNEYRQSGNDEDVMQVFYMAHADTVQRLQQIATEVRKTTKIPRFFTFNPLKALVVRGTSAQLAQAARMIEDRDH
jgi:hypothetical protein